MYFVCVCVCVCVCVISAFIAKLEKSAFLLGNVNGYGQSDVYNLSPMYLPLLEQFQ